MYFLGYQGPIGPVSDGDVGTAFRLMGLGMLGIFVVMLLICLVVAVLNWAAGKKSGRKKSGGNSRNKGN